MALNAMLPAPNLTLDDDYPAELVSVRQMMPPEFI
jgi:hypothetical protein